MLFKKPFKGLPFINKFKLLWALAISYYYEKFLKIQTYRCWNSAGDITYIALLSLPYYVQEPGRKERTRVRLVEEIIYSTEPNLVVGAMVEDIFKEMSFFDKPNQLKQKD